MAQSAGSGDRVIGVQDDDARMNEAIAKAQATLDKFLELKDDPPERAIDFAVKVRIADGESIEYFWVTPFDKAGDHFVGVIEDKPESVHTVTEGQSYEFQRKDISDWMYWQDGKIHGGRTIRALLPQMTPEEAAHYAAILVDD